MDADDARQHLESEQQRLERLRAGFEVEPTREVPGQDRAPATAEHGRDLSILEQVESELADVERALRRLDDGSYGACEACAGPIGDERLAAHPATRFCSAHQEPAERA